MGLPVQKEASQESVTEDTDSQGQPERVWVPHQASHQHEDMPAWGLARACLRNNQKKGQEMQVGWAETCVWQMAGVAWTSCRS